MDRRLEISRILHAALTQPAGERDAFLTAACGGDDALRQRVESLLAATEETRGLDVASPGAAVPRLFSPGDRLAHFRIVSQLGAGGMGEVYRARDEQLDRDVAVKVLPSSSFDDPAARARLVREARAAAALNHPNVCTVHEVGEAGGQAYIAMELVEGRTISAIGAAGPLPIDQVVSYGGQLADALAHAHDRGVVHRDLKSNNVIVTPDGRVKVLDFGLAKRLMDADLAAAVTRLQLSVTEAGVVAGTLPYMAPEQLRGEAAGTASDIWALGVVLHEMSAGVRPFTGQTPFEVSAAILNQPPAVAAHVPVALRAVIERCLAKSPHQRYASAAQVRAALSDIARGTARSTTSARLVTRAGRADAPLVSSRLTRRNVLRVAAAIVVAAGVGAAWRWWPANVDRGRTLAVLPFDNAGNDEDLEYLSDGIADSLIRRIANLPSFRVNNLATVLDFRGRSKDPAAAGRELGVETVLAGTVEQDGPRLRISARLVDVPTGRELWTSRYDREAAELLAIQDEIASAIMDDGLRLRLTDDERQRLIKHPTTSGDAYDLYLQARYLQRRATEEDYLYSRELLERAIIHDPKFALAYVSLAGNYAMMVTDGLERPTDAWPQVSRYIRQAIELDPDLPDVHVMTHAIAFLFDWDWAGAARARQRLLAYPLTDLEPNGLRALAIEHWALGRPGEALQLASRTRELDPRSGYLAILEADYSLRAGQLDAAIALYERAGRLDPDNPNSYFGLAEALFKRGRFDEALAARRKAHALAGDDRLEPLLAKVSGEPGYRQVEEAWVRLQLEALTQRAVTDYVSPLDFARAYAQLGEKERAFTYLDASFADRSPGLVFLKVDPAWEKIRHDPRFAAAIERVGLP